MVELRGEVDLGEEALSTKYRGQLGSEHLERHLPLVLQVLGEIDRRHPALAEFSVEAVAVGEGGSEA